MINGAGGISSPALFLKKRILPLANIALLFAIPTKTICLFITNVSALKMQWLDQVNYLGSLFVKHRLPYWRQTKKDDRKASGPATAG